MHILFHQFEELARLSVDSAVCKKLLYRIGYQRQRSTEIVRNIREEHQLGMRSLLQFMRKLFQLRLLHFQLFLLLYQLCFLFLQFLFLHGQLTVQPILGTQGEVDSHQQADQQQQGGQTAVQDNLLCGIADQILVYLSVQGFYLSIQGADMSGLHLHDESIVAIDDGSTQDSFTGKITLVQDIHGNLHHTVATGRIYKRGIQFAGKHFLHSVVFAGQGVYADEPHFFLPSLASNGSIGPCRHAVILCIHQVDMRETV